MIELCGVYKKTGADYALTNISFEIAQGEAAAVLGRRFSGKTAIADLMAGCTYATHGTVRVDGIDMQKHPLEAKRAIGYMPQRLSLYPEMTADEYLSFVCSLMGIRKKDTKQHIEAAVEKAGAAEARWQLIRNITREAQQRLALAGALCGSPKALILDEPTLGLDPDASDALRETIKTLKSEYTIALLTRSIHEAVDVCGSVIVLRKGTVTVKQEAESLQRSAGGQRRISVRFKTTRQCGLELLRSIEGVEYVMPLGSGESGACDFTVESSEDVREDIFCAAAKANIVLLALSGVSVTLDDIYTELAGGEQQ